MSAARFFPASELFVAGDKQAMPAEALGGVLSAGNDHGVFLYGPYTAARGGVYRLQVDAAAIRDGGRLHFDCFDASLDCRLYLSADFNGELEAYVRVYDTERLEFRFHLAGHHVLAKGVTFEPVLLDEEGATPDQLRAMIERVESRHLNMQAKLRLMDRLADVEEAEEAERARERLVADLADTPQVRVSTALATLGGPARPSKPVDKSTIVASREEVFEVVSQRSLTTLDLLQLTPDVRSELAARGYAADLILATRLHRDYAEPLRLWHDCPLRSGVAGRFPPRQPLFERYVDIDRSYQASLANGLGMAAYCPVSGALIRSTHGFLQLFCDLPFSFYYFEGAEPFYICTGHISNSKLFIFMPRTGTIVWIGDPWYRNYQAEDVTRHLMRNLATHVDEVASYLAAPTRPAAVMGSNIYGHWFWTSLSGLDYALTSGLTTGLAELIRVPKQFMNISEILPELSNLPSPEILDEAAAFRHCIKHGLVPIHFTDVAMSTELVERLQRLAVERATDAGRVPVDAARPLIWINLRAHTKVWIDQAQGYANILNRLHEEFGHVSAFIDGMPDCVEIATEIRRLTTPEVALFDGLRISFYDSLSWALSIDAFVSVISSGLLIVNIFGDKSGVAHAEHGHLTQMEWWHTIKPGAKAPLHPSFEQVIEHGGGLYSNYEMDWRVIYDLLIKALQQAGVRRHGGDNNEVAETRA